MAKTVNYKKIMPLSIHLGRKAIKTEPALLEFFCDEVKDIYWAEKHLTKVLPKMKKAATSPDLAQAIGDHLEVTKTHIERLEIVFELLGKKTQAKKSEAMEGITKEGEGILEDTDKGTATRDVGIILASQKIKHFEISTYGGLAQLAETLGLDEIKALLGQTLDEEKQADEMLSDIAKNKIDYQFYDTSADILETDEEEEIFSEKLLKEVQATGRQAARTAMEVMGYLVIIEDGWIIRKYKDGHSIKLSSIIV